jgi:NUBPL iron-transfer P-loop NTPase
MTHLQDQLKRETKISDFAEWVGAQVDAGASSRLFVEFRNHLDKFTRDDSIPDYDVLFKATLGAGITIACQTNDRVQKKYMDDLAGLLRPQRKGTIRGTRPSNHAVIADFVINEFSYADQFLNSFALRSQLYKRLERHFDKVTASHPIRDYRDGWKLLNEIRRNQGRALESARDPSRRKDFEVILVGSIKGGVGKSMISIALAHYLQSRNRSGACIVDLDVMGPTLQFNLDIPDISKALSVNPDKHASRERYWPYATFLDLLKNPSLMGNQIYLNSAELGSPGALKTVVLPDSPTVASTELAAPFFNTVARMEFLIALRRLLDGMQAENIRYVIIDLAPGLFGTNGVIFNWLTTLYPTSLVLVSSPRSFDIGTSFYEGFWLSAQEYVPWHRPILHLLNMRPADEVEEKRTDRQIREYVDDIVSVVFQHDFGYGSAPSSGQYVLFWRLRSYLYKIALDQVRKKAYRNFYELIPLRYEERLRTLSQEGSLSAVKMEPLVGAHWYQLDLAPAVNKWMQRHFGDRQ